MAVHLAVAGDALMVSYFLGCPFLHEMSWMRSGTEMNQFLRIFLPIFLKEKPLVSLQIITMSFNKPIYHVLIILSFNENT